MRKTTHPTEYVMPTPLQRLPDEPSAAHAALVLYAQLGEGRSLDALAEQCRSNAIVRPPTRRRRTLATWSARFLWSERVSAYDEDLRAAELARHETVWAARREQVREESWSLAQRILGRAQELLEQSFLEEVKLDGVLVLKPRWSMRDIATLAESYSKLARLAAGMDTDQQRVIIEGLSPADLESLDDAELEKLWEKMGKKR